MEVELQYTPDVQSFYELNQNATINLNEKALSKNRSLNSNQKNYFKSLVNDINSMSGNVSTDNVAEAQDKYRKLLNLSGLYGIRDYIKVGNYTGELKEVKPQAMGMGEKKPEVYASNFPGCPKESDLKKGYIPSTWIDENGMEVEQIVEGEWKYNRDTGQWEGMVNGETSIKNRAEVPEWEVFIPEDRIIKRVLNIMPTQVKMGTNDWRESFKGRKRMNDGRYQARVGTSR